MKLGWDNVHQRTKLDCDRMVLFTPPHQQYAIRVENSRACLSLENITWIGIDPSLSGRIRGFWTGVKILAWIAFKGRPYNT